MKGRCRKTIPGSKFGFCTQNLLPNIVPVEESENRLFCFAQIRFGSASFPSSFPLRGTPILIGYGQQRQAGNHGTVRGYQNFHALFRQLLHRLADGGDEEIFLLPAELADAVEADDLYVLRDPVSLAAQKPEKMIAVVIGMGEDAVKGQRSVGLLWRSRKSRM